MFSLEKKESGGISLLSATTWKEVAVRWGSVSSRKQMTGREKKLCQRMELVIKKNFFMKRIVKHCNKLPGALVESPCLEMFKRHVDVALGDMVWWQTQWCWVNGWTLLS